MTSRLEALKQGVADKHINEIIKQDEAKAKKEWEESPDLQGRFKVVEDYEKHVLNNEREALTKGREAFRKTLDGKTEDENQPDLEGEDQPIGYEGNQ